MSCGLGSALVLMMANCQVRIDNESSSFTECGYERPSQTAGLLRGAAGPPTRRLRRERRGSEAPRRRAPTRTNPRRRAAAPQRGQIRGAAPPRPNEGSERLARTTESLRLEEKSERSEGPSEARTCEPKASIKSEPRIAAGGEDSRARRASDKMTS
jgi:hypothetical protein